MLKGNVIDFIGLADISLLPQSKHVQCHFHYLGPWLNFSSRLIPNPFHHFFPFHWQWLKFMLANLWSALSAYKTSNILEFLVKNSKKKPNKQNPASIPSTFVYVIRLLFIDKHHPGHFIPKCSTSYSMMNGLNSQTFMASTPQLQTETTNCFISNWIVKQQLVEDNLCSHVRCSFSKAFFDYFMKKNAFSGVRNWGCWKGSEAAIMVAWTSDTTDPPRF